LGHPTHMISIDFKTELSEHNSKLGFEVEVKISDNAIGEETN